MTTLAEPGSGTPAAFGSLRLRWGERLAGYPYVLPAVLVVTAVMSYPFVYSIYLSFRATPSYTTRTHFNGLANYHAVLHDPIFLHSLLTTVIWTAGSTIADLLLGMGAALLVDRLRWFRGPARAALMLPYIVGYVVASYAWLWLYQAEYGLLNDLLASSHLISRPISFLSSLTWALPAVMLVNIWKTAPFAMIMFLAGLQAVPEQTVLAAGLDGASPARAFLEVKLPYLRRVIVITSIVLTFQNFNTFTIPYIMTSGGPLNRTEIVSNYIYDVAFTNLNFGRAAAASVVVMIILMLFAIAYAGSLSRRPPGVV
ncbi:MAG TPA: sugar ABC transporter permease [Acetobacteraceae bacterium]|nr:sugar ABC transporter permease [Acetobacteraceae bacterium]